jgi:hypothetical protein
VGREATGAGVRGAATTTMVTGGITRMANEYISLANYKTLNGITGTASDAIISMVLEQASRLIDKYCGRIFYSQTAVELFDGNGTSVYYTLHRPIINVTSLERDRDDDGVFEETIDTEDYKVYENRIGLLKYATEGIYSGEASTFFRGQQNWRVTYTYGVAAIPKPVELATAMLTSFLLTDGAGTQVLAAHDGILSERIGNYSYRKGEALMASGVFPASVRSVLSLYRGLRIGGRDGQG